MTVKIVKHYRMSIAWAIIIFVLCSVPSKGVPSFKLFEISNFDKFVHFSLYIILGILLFWESRYNRASRELSTRIIVIVGAISIGYGCFIELFQYLFATSRSAEGLDIVANVIGFILSVVIYPKVERGVLFFMSKKQM